jgi:Ca-activated chloride channel family protein
MKAPIIELIPLRGAICSDSKTTLDVLVKITPPEPEANLKRPAINLGLVIDRSGSMSGDNKITFAKAAACYAVQQLLPSDRVSVTIYDDDVETIVPSTLTTDKPYILSQIERIQPRNMTALHAGWSQGGLQVSNYLNQEHLNRVILLSDGLANAGQTNPDVIGSDVRKLAEQSVSTTTMGVGNDYNEDLLEGMASSGDGNYYYIQSPEQLLAIFQTELQGLMATIGRRVRLKIEPQGGVEVADVFNDLEVTKKGQFRLPNLVMNNPFVVAVRLKVPAISQATECNFRLAWDDPEQQKRQKLYASLQLPVVSAAELESFPLNPEVQRQVAIMLSGRAKKEAMQKVDRGEFEAASQLLKDTREQVLTAPDSLLIQQEAQSLVDLDTDLQARQLQQFRKRSGYESHSSSRSMSQRSHGDYYTQRYKEAVRSRIEVIQGDITQQQVDAIVNASNNDLSGSVGVDAAIHQAAGLELKQACQQLNGCSTGEAKITAGYNLPAQWVIHTASSVWQGGGYGEAQILAQCYDSCLSIAEQNSIQTMAFPSIGTGVCGFPINIASKIALDQVVNYLYRHPSIVKVIFVCFDKKVYDFYLAALQ